MPSLIGIPTSSPTSAFSAKPPSGVRIATIALPSLRKSGGCLWAVSRPISAGPAVGSTFTSGRKVIGGHGPEPDIARHVLTRAVSSQTLANVLGKGYDDYSSSAAVGARASSPRIKLPAYVQLCCLHSALAEL